jgi:pyrimidine-specific ribonucleoside hydrolase
METRDPDDVLTLCLLASHPAVELAAVTVNPGTRAQVGIVSHLLERLNVDVPIGARTPERDDGAVSAFHETWLGSVPHASAAAPAHELLAATFLDGRASVLLTTGPLHNVRQLLQRHPAAEVPRWVAQGGFAGANLVAPADRLPEFGDAVTRESFNFGHDSKGALLALTTGRVATRELVSKNVTHGVVWDAALQREVSNRAELSLGLRLVVNAMRTYLRERPSGKALHDPLAAAAVVDSGAFTWAEVEVYRDQGRWGARAARRTNTVISVAVDRDRALSAILNVPLGMTS